MRIYLHLKRMDFRLSLCLFHFHQLINILLHLIKHRIIRERKFPYFRTSLHLHKLVQSPFTNASHLFHQLIKRSCLLSYQKKNNDYDNRSNKGCHTDNIAKIIYSIECHIRMNHTKHRVICTLKSLYHIACNLSIFFPIHSFYMGFFHLFYYFKKFSRISGILQIFLSI